MDSSTASLIGAFIGALAGVSGAVVTQMLNTKKEQKQWCRLKKDESYSNTLRYCMKARNKRSKINAKVGPILGEDAVKEWFDEINEASVWLTNLSIYCSPLYKDEIVKVSEVLRKSIEAFCGHSDIKSDGINTTQISRPLTGKVNIPNLFSSLKHVHETILECARKDIGFNGLDK